MTVHKIEVPRPRRGYPAGIYIWSEREPAEYQRARSMVSMIARHLGLESYQVLDGTLIRRFQPARCMSAAILHALMGIGNKKIARVFKVQKSTARRFRDKAAQMFAEDPEFLRLHGEATAAILRRWPEYGRKP